MSPSPGAPGEGRQPLLADLRTARLSLRRPTVEDAQVLLERVFDDPRTWRLDPALRSGPAADVQGYLRLLAERWDAHGLASWVVRETHAHGPGGTVGLGAPTRPPRCCSTPTDRSRRRWSTRCWAETTSPGAGLAGAARRWSRCRWSPLASAP